MKKAFLFTFILLVTLAGAAVYNAGVVRQATANQREGILLECDSNAVSQQLNVRGMSRIQLVVTGLDSARVLVSYLFGGIDYLTPTARAEVLDTVKIRVYTDTLSTNGVHILTAPMGTAMQVQTDKVDDSVVVFFNMSTY